MAPVPKSAPTEEEIITRLVEKLKPEIERYAEAYADHQRIELQRNDRTFYSYSERLPDFGIGQEKRFFEMGQEMGRKMAIQGIFNQIGPLNLNTKAEPWDNRNPAPPAAPSPNFMELQAAQKKLIEKRDRLLTELLQDHPTFRDRTEKELDAIFDEDPQKRRVSMTDPITIMREVEETVDVEALYEKVRTGKITREAAKERMYLEIMKTARKQVHSALGNDHDRQTISPAIEGRKRESWQRVLAPELSKLEQQFAKEWQEVEKAFKQTPKEKISLGEEDRSRSFIEQLERQKNAMRPPKEEASLVGELWLKGKSMLRTLIDRGIERYNYPLQPALEEFRAHAIDTLVKQGSTRAWARERIQALEIHLMEKSGMWKEAPRGLPTKPNPLHLAQEGIIDIPLDAPPLQPLPPVDNVPKPAQGQNRAG